MYNLLLHFTQHPSPSLPPLQGLALYSRAHGGAHHQRSRPQHPSPSWQQLLSTGNRQMGCRLSTRPLNTQARSTLKIGTGLSTHRPLSTQASTDGSPSRFWAHSSSHRCSGRRRRGGSTGEASRKVCPSRRPEIIRPLQDVDILLIKKQKFNNVFSRKYQ